MLHRLIYVSRAHTLMPMDIKDILVESRRNNPKLNVTGALCFLDGVYLRYLEGDKNTLKTLYLRIQADPRHSRSAIVDMQPIDSRLFLDWSMALLTWSEECKAIFRRFSPGSGLDLYTLDKSTAAQMFRALAKTNNWLEI